jgi:hypothetical protein
VTSTLAKQAAAKAAQAAPAAQPSEGQEATPPAPPVEVAEPPLVEPDMPEDEPETVPVHVAWSRVMASVRKIRKADEYKAPGTRYNFRGVDRTVNAFAPVLREHGVLVLPVKVDASYRDFKNGEKTRRECTVTVTWMVMGPAGDTLPSTLQSAGEALDSSDKGTAKAQSVALRVLLLTAAMVPTDDPDPDSRHIERGEAAVRSAVSYVEEVTNPRTTVSRLLQIKHELTQTGQFGVMVMNEVGDDEAIGAMVNRIGRERIGAAGGGS